MTKIAVVSDVHLKLRKHVEFERNRFQLLIQHLEESDADVIIFNGDLFDYARPTLEEIQLVTQAMWALSDKQIHITAGNHEAVSKWLCTYDFLRLPNVITQSSKSKVIGFDDVCIQLCHWEVLSRLVELDPMDILITHYRSAMKGLYDEEVDTSKFINNYKLVLLGDIHSRYSPNPHVFYTGSPYSISNIRDTRERFGYIELTTDKGEHSWKYKDLKLPQKIRVDLAFKEVKDFKPKPEHLYTLYVKGTLQELSTLNSTKNVIYKKLVELKSVVKSTTEPTDKPFIDTLVDKVVPQIKGTPTQKRNTKNIIVQLQGDT